VPTMAVWLLRGQVHFHGTAPPGSAAAKPGPFKRFQIGFERRFEQLRSAYRDLLGRITARCGRFILLFLGLTLASLSLVTFLGSNFFPEVRSNSLALHMRTRIGTRIEEAGKLAVLVNQEIHRALPGKVRGIVDNCGLPVSGTNSVYGSSGTIGPQDCDLTITLASSDSPVQQYRQILRDRLAMAFPGTTFTFGPGDITAQILNFGLPAPIDIQIIGRDQPANFAYAREVLHRISTIPGIADPNIFQAFDAPTLRIAASRSFATRTGLTEADVADNALAMLSGSGQVAPTYWLNTRNGVSYLVNLQAPQPDLDSMNAIETLPIDVGNGDPSGHSMQLLGALSQISQTGLPLVASHYDITPVVDVYAGVDGRDLGAVAAGINRVLRETAKDLPHSARVEVRGQVVTMATAYSQLLTGLMVSVVLVYLVIVVNFQSWLDPFIIITALPGALAGIAWSLFITDTTLSVPALTGAIMCMGTATANSILVVAFARERLAEHGDAARAAVEAGYGRIRPVMMTALAMVIGMVPMAMSNTQNAPIGRAVIGGLVVATVSTLLFVPAVFALLHGRRNDKRNKAEAV
jgi:multidrug efflux pump subunit AcrB